MTSHPRWALVLGGSLGVVAAVLVVTGFSAPTGATVLLAGHAYAEETEELFGDQAFLHYSFLGVNFTFHLWCFTSPAAGQVCGNATESGGATYPYAFYDGPVGMGPTSWQTWISPDGHEAVQYHTGGEARLLVAVL